MGVFRCIKVDGSWDNLETAHATLADLHADLRTGPVLGALLMSTRGETGAERIVTGRRGVIVNGNYYTAIEDCTVRFVERGAT